MKIRPTILELSLAKQKDGRKGIYFKPVYLFIKIFLSVWHKARNTPISDLRQTNVEVIRLKSKRRKSWDTYSQIKDNIKMNINEIRRNYLYWLRIRTSGGLLWKRRWNFGFPKMGYLLTRTTLMLSRQIMSHAQWQVDDRQYRSRVVRPGGQGTVGAWHKQFLFSTASEMFWSPSVCGCWGPFPPGSAPGPWIFHARLSVDEAKSHAAICKSPLRLHEVVFN
jgi:hypothetical protein